MAKKLVKKSEQRKPFGKYHVEKHEILEIYTKEPKTINDPIPADVNLAYSILRKMWADEGGQKFVRHLCARFNPGCITGWNHVLNFTPEFLETHTNRDAIAGYECIGLREFATLFTEYNPIILKAKATLGQLTDDDKDEIKRLVDATPKTVKNNRVAYCSPKSDKILSHASYKALLIFQEIHEKDLHKELSVSIHDKLGWNEPKETPEEYEARQKRNKQSRPYVSTNSLSDLLTPEAIAKLEQIK